VAAVICTNWICRKCRGIINTLLVCRSCGAIYTMAELQYEWRRRRRRR